MNWEIDISIIAIELIEDNVLNYLNGCSIFPLLKIFAKNDPVIIYSLRFQACMTFFLQWNTKGNVLDNVNAALILYIESMPGTDKCSLKVSHTIHILHYILFL